MRHPLTSTATRSNASASPRNANSRAYVNLIKEPHLENGITSKEAVECLVYKKRWLILMLYWAYTIAGAMHWIEYSVIADVISKYYSVPYSAVDWSSMIFLLLYIPFSIPGSYILDKLGLRASVLLGATGICLGAWMKVLAVDSNRFWVLMLGQGVIAIFQVLILPVPPKLAAVWFGSNEVSFACSIGIVAAQVAVGIGFITPSLMVEQGTFEAMQKSLQNLSFVFAAPMTLVIPVLYFLFDDAPPTPPSLAQQQIQENEKEMLSYKECLKNLFKNKSFVMFNIFFGINIGMSTTITILLNQIVLFYHPDAFTDVGIIGLLMTLSAIIGSILVGFFIAKFGKLREIIWIFTSLSLILMTVFFALLIQNLVYLYVLGVLLSFSISCVLCAGFDLGVELTYPEPVGASSGLLTISYQIFGILFTYLYSILFYTFNILTANLCMVFIVLFTDVLLIFIKFEFKRNAANTLKFKS